MRELIESLSREFDRIERDYTKEPNIRGREDLILFLCGVNIELQKQIRAIGDHENPKKIYLILERFFNDPSYPPEVAALISKYKVKAGQKIVNLKTIEYEKVYMPDGDTASTVSTIPLDPVNNDDLETHAPDISPEAASDYTNLFHEYSGHLSKCRLAQSFQTRRIESSETLTRGFTL